MKSLGKFVQEHGEKDDGAEPRGDQKARGDGDAVEEGVDYETDQDAALRVAVLHLGGVRFFSEVKVGSEGVFEEMDQEEADQHVNQRVLAGEADRFGDHFHEGDGQHVSGAECHEVLQVLPRPVATHHEVATEQISAARN